MSTFGGWMPEFPDIRVDYFRHIEGIRPPLACFLSHVHSDHLSGLESLKSPFVYCSAATKELLLRLERYPHRVNFELGILESRKQHYKHLKNLLKPIPLETPTRIELAPGCHIQVTLFDANHCMGAVMFLIEGNGQAILYTGDIRSEPWFLNALIRNPILIEYTSGLKTLDCIYLDTSFTDNVSFPTKAEGLEELLQKVSKYPPDTVFHFSAWTFGYEDVWITLSRALKSQIHVDNYKMRLYQSLRGEFNGTDRLCGPFLAQESPILTGYMVGNTEQTGILTLDDKVKLHSCDKGIKCNHLNRKTVWIRPIIARMPSGQEIAEIGVGGRGGDLTRRPELELDSDVIIQKFVEVFAGAESSVMSEIQALLTGGLRSSRKTISLDGMGFDPEQNKLTVEDLAKVLTQSVTKKHASLTENSGKLEELDLPSVITFPYSRHSSYAELHALVKAFKPKDVYPCTIDKTKWHEGVSIGCLFGDLCSEKIFRHDCQMRELFGALTDLHQDDTQKSWTTSSTESSKETGSSTGSDDEKRHKNELIENQAMLVQKPRKIIEHSEFLTNNSSPETEPTSITFLAESRDRLSPTKSDGARSSTTDKLTNIPGSDSQPRRRKASLETRDDGCQKRIRLQKRSDEAGYDTSSEDFHTSGEESTPEKQAEGVAGVSYYDVEHQIYRCIACDWEMWTRSGQCTSCGTGEPSYYEVFDSDPVTRAPGQHDCFPGIAPSMDCDDDEIQSCVPSELAECYLDGASAYDSPTEPDGNEYEANSFIDDASIDTQRQEDSPCSTDLESSRIHTQNQVNMSGVAVQGSDYKQLYESLSRTYGQLVEEHNELINDYFSLRRDFFSSQSDDEDSADVQFASVDIEERDLPISEVTLSQIQGDSQASAISPERLRTRIDAFIAIAHDEEEGWNNISLISTSDNHTEAEIEL